MKLLINFNKTHLRGWPKRVALQIDKPRPARIENQPSQQGAQTQPTRLVGDQKLLRLYKAIDLAG